MTGFREEGIWVAKECELPAALERIGEALALAALHIFCEAAKRDVATVELAQQVARYLRRAQDDPELRFDPAEGE